MLSFFGFTISEIISLLVGFTIPAYYSFKAIETEDNLDDDKQWLTYWIIYGLFQFIERTTYWVISLIPYYWEIKMVFFIFLMAPTTKGALIVYTKFLAPFLKKHEKNIDDAIESSKSLTKKKLYDAGANMVKSGIDAVKNSKIKETIINTAVDTVMGKKEDNDAVNNLVKASLTQVVDSKTKELESKLDEKEEEKKVEEKKEEKVEEKKEEEKKAEEDEEESESDDGEGGDMGDLLGELGEEEEEEDFEEKVESLKEMVEKKCGEFFFYSDGLKSGSIKSSQFLKFFNTFTKTSGKTYEAKDLETKFGTDKTLSKKDCVGSLSEDLERVVKEVKEDTIDELKASLLKELEKEIGAARKEWKKLGNKD